MKALKHIINGTVWTLLGLYAIVLLAIHIPAVQREIGSKTAELLSETLGTEVKVGRIDLGFLNRLIIDDVVVYDQQHKILLKAARVTAKVDPTSFILGKISISSAQIFGAKAHLSRKDAESPTNFQFILDALASNDTTSNRPLDLRVNSFIMRNSSISYDQWDVPSTPGKFNPQHLNVLNISAHVILKVLREDSINVNVKRLTFLEQSGINVRRLALRFAAGNQNGELQDFHLQLPETDIHIDSLVATYNRRQFQESLRFQGGIDNTSITPSDFRGLIPALKNYQHTLLLKTDFSYEGHTLTVPRLQIESEMGDLSLQAGGHFTHSPNGKDTWKAGVSHLLVTNEAIDFLSKRIVKLPEPLLRIGNVQLKGTFGGDEEGTLMADADVTTGIGQIDAQIQLTEDKHFTASFNTDGIHVGQLVDNDKLGVIAAKMETNGTVSSQIAAKGRIEKFEYEGTTYEHIELDGNYAPNHIDGRLSINDPKVKAGLELNINGTDINSAEGIISLQDLSLPEKDYNLDYLRIESGFEEGVHFLTLNSDFAHADISGEFDYATLAQSFANAIGSKLPTLPGLPPLTKDTKNNFTIHLKVAKTDWAEKLLGIPLDTHQTITLDANFNDNTRQIVANLDVPSFSYNGHLYERGTVNISSPLDTLMLQASIWSIEDDREPFALKVDGHAADNNISFALAWNNNDAVSPFHGVLNASAELYRNLSDQSEAHVRIFPSNVTLRNAQWLIEPSDILYSEGRLLIDNFAVHNGEQYIKADGIASSQKTDSVTVTLNNIEVADILDLVDFDAVTFSGYASGNAILVSAFDDPDAYANLTVDNFKFQEGRMGTLLARVDWNKQMKQIDINATANDGPDAITFINGYVSPEREYIDLGLHARGTYLDFMHSFTESFISHITGHGKGDLRLAGPLSAINLTGGLRIDGEATITPLNTTYWLRNDTITLVYNEILIDSLPIHDKYNNVGYLSGAIHHEDLTNLSLDLHVDTDQLLGYDFHDFGDQSFYGTVFASGTVDIRMKGDDVHIDCNVSPLKNSVFVYNAAQNDAISDQEFITWKVPVANTATATAVTPQSSSSNIYMNFLVNVTPVGTMRILMDAKTGDYITLNGSGSLQASYYNKGAFEMQGTYAVESGTYDVTIQGIINKKFQFQPGSTIVFGGDPYSAALNLQALYTVNGVSLSDLQLGNTFSSNTVRVNCLMNIGGQPSSPQVTFDLDLPTVNADEKQMVRSLLSSQQEMNQQVLYLLGIGRFYSQGQNNAGEQQEQSRTSLAMQSFLSGTLSTQINNAINQIVRNDDWNFGANISTGTEGWNNAEYEGIVAGRMLNNRLLINGQFGYRDNATQASPSFIGDFDIRYLLLPNGNLALKVYNQTNDRYFTRSSMNTQGVGIIMKKDFNGLRDLFGRKKKE